MQGEQVDRNLSDILSSFLPGEWVAGHYRLLPSPGIQTQTAAQGVTECSTGPTAQGPNWHGYGQWPSLCCDIYLTPPPHLIG